MLRNIIHLSGSQIANFGFPLVQIPLLIFAYGTDQYADLVLFQSCLVIYQALCNLGLEVSSVRLVAKQAEPSSVNRLFAVRNILLLLTFPVFVVLVLYVLPLPVSTIWALPYAAFIFFVPNIVFLSSGDYKKLLVFNLQVKGGLLLTLIAIVLLRLDFSFVFFAYSFVYVIAVFRVHLSELNLRAMFSVSLEFNKIKETFLLMKPYIIASFYGNSKDRIVIVLAEYFVGPSLLVIMDIFSKVNVVLAIPVNAFIQVVYRNKVNSYVHKVNSNYYLFVAIYIALIVSSLPLAIMVLDLNLEIQFILVILIIGMFVSWASQYFSRIFLYVKELYQVVSNNVKFMLSVLLLISVVLNGMSEVPAWTFVLFYVLLLNGLEFSHKLFFGLKSNEKARKS